MSISPDRGIARIEPTVSDRGARRLGVVVITLHDNVAANRDLARKFIELATSPAVQAEGIVTKFNWYPGIDADHVKASLDPQAWAALFSDVTPQDLSAKGKSFPIAPYFNDILEAYEKNVAK